MIARDKCLRSTWQVISRQLDGARVNFESERKNRNPQKDALYNYFIRDDNQAPQRTKNPLSVKKNCSQHHKSSSETQGRSSGSKTGMPPGEKKLF